jgi:phosphinothricin acetyltransferase
MDVTRRVTIADAPAIAAIYNHYVDHSIVTFEETPVSEGEMARRIEAVLVTYDWLVLERDETVLGYAYAGRFHERASYRFTTLSTVYLAPSACGQRLGGPLYKALIESIFALGFRHAIGLISLPNDASVRLHEALGFSKAAHYQRVGKKFDRWIDVGGWQLENPHFDEHKSQLL